MIISRTPYRISFFGGGTDYPDWYLKNGGSVLATAIDKYCYITCRYLPPFFEHKIRIVYSRVESCQSINDIQHPSVRETLRFIKVKRGVEIHHDGDLPARSGMGSSSSFTVGLLHTLYAIEGKMPTKKQLALDSIHIEQNMIKETVGSQDQVSAAYGGFNKIDFSTNGDINVNLIVLSKDRLKELNEHLMLLYTGIVRTASNVAVSYVNNIDKKSELLNRMHNMVDEGISILKGNSCVCKFGELLNEAWKAKRGLSSKVTNSTVDELYEFAKSNGAIGGKLTGAGGGGFLLLFVPPSHQKKVREAFGNMIHVPFSFEPNGSQIIFYDPDQKDYSSIENDRTNRTISPFRELTQ
ncbi:MAG: kinase [Desulfobacterales bacterium]|nr:kinase [Desulfobacterales bacterium]